MQTIYLNSKNEEVEMKEMHTPHLLYSIAKNSRELGAGLYLTEERERKEKEIKGMHHEVMRRFAELSEDAK